MSAICDVWTTEAEVRDCCGKLPEDQDITTQIRLASEILYEFSGRQFSGACEQTIRPNQSRCGCLCHFSHDQYSHSATCGCGYQIDLGDIYVTEVGEVRLNGAVVDEATYQIQSGRYLVRLRDENGVNPGWPCCQSLDLATTEVGTFSVTFTSGLPIPEGARAAASVLACQLGLACGGPDISKFCALPANVTSIARQGVTMNKGRVLSAFSLRKTGLSDVDLWLEAVNGAGLLAPSRVVSADDPAPRYV